MSENRIRSYAALTAKSALVPYEFDAGELQPHQVEVKVEYCGLCHSDLSIIDNDWGVSQYPVVAFLVHDLAVKSRPPQYPVLK